MRNIPRRQRRMIATFVVAGIGAILTEHVLGPKLKGKLRV